MFSLDGLLESLVFFRSHQELRRDTSSQLRVSAMFLVKIKKASIDHILFKVSGVLVKRNPNDSLQNSNHSNGGSMGLFKGNVLVPERMRDKVISNSSDASLEETVCVSISLLRSPMSEPTYPRVSSTDSGNFSE